MFARLSILIVAACGAAAPRTAPRQPGWVWDLAPAQVAAACRAAEVDLDAQLAKLVAIPDHERTFANTVAALEAAVSDYDEATSPLTLLEVLHRDAAVRSAGTACADEVARVANARDARVDVYRAVRAYVAGAGQREKLDADQVWLRDRFLRDFQRNGLGASDAARARVAELRTKQNQIANAYSAHLTEDEIAMRLELDREELAGMPDDYLARLERTAGGKLVVRASYPDIFPLLKQCRVEATRQRAWLLLWGRGGQPNVARLRDVLALRDEEYRLLGYASYADFVSEVNMTGSRRAIDAFLVRTRESFMPRIRRDVEVLEQLAAEETGRPRARIAAADQFYYRERWRARDFAFDEESVRRYFPADRVVSGMLRTYERALGLRFEREPLRGWAPGVEQYAMRDAATGELLAHFYLDLLPRPGKYSHAAIFTIRGPRIVDGVRQPPLSVLVTNIEPPHDGRVSHLLIDEIRTLFHEFGHIVHFSLGRSRYRMQKSVERDFLEAPSTLFERWPYDRAVLALISADPDRPGQPAPDDVRKKLTAARTFGASLFWAGQLGYAFADQKMHLEPGLDPDVVMRESFAELCGYTQDPDEHFAASFLHAMGGYPTAYYAYVWSAAYAADMFTRFAAEGVFGARVGRDYRAIILERSGREPTAKLVERFLGRPFDEKSLLRSLDP